MISWAKFSREHLLAPNGLSVLRGILGLLVPFFLLHPKPGFHLAALVLFIVAAITDYYDGFLARRFALESAIGKFIDPLADKILILAPLCTFSVLGMFSPWWVVPIAAREIVVTFCRIGWLLEGKALGAEKLGKFKLGFQIAAVGTPFLFFLSSEFSLPLWISAFFKILMYFSLFVATVLTLVSGFTFLFHHRSHFKSRAFARFVSAVWLGLIPFAPGTWGSLAGLGLVALTTWNASLYGATFVLLVIAGYRAVKQLDLTVQKDPPFVVIDEVLGILVAFSGIPLTLTSAVAGFLLFRLFDIVKPFPLRKLENLPGYWGILCDDLGAGFYAWLVLRAFFPHL